MVRGVVEVGGGGVGVYMMDMSIALLRVPSMAGLIVL